MPDAWPRGASNFYRLQTVLKTAASLYTESVRVDIDPRNRPVLKPTVIHMGGHPSLSITIIPTSPTR